MHAIRSGARHWLAVLTVAFTVLVVSAGAPSTPSGGPSDARAETYWQGDCFQDSWCSWYISRLYNRNRACSFTGDARIGAKFIRISDGHDLYRTFSYWCVDTGFVDWGSCRYALAANGGTYTWLYISGNGDWPGDC